MGFIEIFKDDNDYNEKSIIGFGAFATMVLFALVDLGTGIAGIYGGLTGNNPFAAVGKAFGFGN